MKTHGRSRKFHTTLTVETEKFLLMFRYQNAVLALLVPQILKNKHQLQQQNHMVSIMIQGRMECVPVNKARSQPALTSHHLAKWKPSKEPREME